MDAHGDGVRGRAHRLADGRLGRLGWKANVPSAREFVRDAMGAELGITVPAVAGETFGSTRDGDRVADPELTPAELDELAHFLAQLAPPPRTSTDPAREALGAQVFVRVGCDACHRSLRDDAGAEVPLYSDLLLHDVAAPDARGIADGAAGPRDFRTPPLWGMGRTAPYLHDGRASSAEAAIAAHQGEAAASSRAVSQLAPADREALLAFLRSL